MKIIQLHLWIQNRQGTWTTPEVVRFSKKYPDGKAARGKRIVLEPDSQSMADIKLQLAKEVNRWRGQIESYYVVVVVEKSDGTEGFRTIVPKTILTS